MNSCHARSTRADGVRCPSLFSEASIKNLITSPSACLHSAGEQNSVRANFWTSSGRVRRISDAICSGHKFLVISSMSCLKFLAGNRLEFVQDSFRRACRFDFKLFWIHPTYGASIVCRTSLGHDIHATVLRKGGPGWNLQPPDTFGLVVNVFDWIGALAGTIDRNRLKKFFVDAQVIIDARWNRSSWHGHVGRNGLLVGPDCQVF